MWWLLGGLGIIALVNIMKKITKKEGKSTELIPSEVKRYIPGSPEQIELFEKAAYLINVPVEWARSKGLKRLLEKESGGWVGRPNYTYGSRAKSKKEWPQIWEELRNGITSAKSSATGLGQLLLKNVDIYYPNGRKGIGIPLEEAAGMLAYIKARYGSPEKAIAFHDDPKKKHEGY